MNQVVISSSILQQKVEKRNYKNIAKVPNDIQIEIYQETMADLEKYLDVGDLRKLTTKSLGVIRDDILGIINGIRTLNSNIPLGKLNSIDGALDKLREARDGFQVAIGMFDIYGKLKESKSKEFFDQMKKTRKHIEGALKFFKLN